MFRIDSKMPVEAYKTYSLLAPLRTHFRKATCEEAECEAFRNGWKTVVPEGSGQASYIRRNSGRSFKEGPKGTFEFAPGQTCFRAADHRIRIEREPLYVVRGGDHRGNPQNWRVEHASADNWVEDFGGHQDFIKDAIGRG